ncbi:hypothetical protein LEN26_005730 [Aphanomyces euteiches]|nr:hypothetical protein LEN26_005730 [Aphanomyces euteiches]
MASMLEYTVHWESGNLGVWLQEDPFGSAVISKLVRPLPHHFTSLGDHVGSVGDLLISVGGRGVDKEYATAIDLLQNASLPIDLVFLNRRDETPVYTKNELAHTYEFEWTEHDGKLGLSFAKDPTTLLTILSSVNEDVMPPALKACHPRVGDIVLSIGAANVTEMKFHDVLAMLGHVEKPIRLSFEQVPVPSPTTVPPPTVPPPATTSSMYDILFSGDSLGIVFTKGNARPVIKSTTGAHPEASVGDELISVNDQDTIALGFLETMEKIKHLDGKSSVLLRFHQPTPQVVDNAYDILFSGGRLGLVLVGGPTPTSHPVLEKVTDASTARGLELAEKGDMLVSVDGINTATLGFDKTVEMIKHVHGRTVLLHFRREAKISTTNMVLSLVGALFI